MPSIDMRWNITDLGWNSDFEQYYRQWERDFPSLPQQNSTPARVAREDREAYLVCSAAGTRLARVTGRLRHNARSRADFPAVGDWVVAELPPGAGRDAGAGPAASDGVTAREGLAVIHAILPRRSVFSRTAAGGQGGARAGQQAGRAEEQVVAANIDTVFLVSGLDGDFNLRRIERYLTLAWESGAAPVIVLNKADLCDRTPMEAARLTEMEAAGRTEADADPEAWNAGGTEPGAAAAATPGELDARRAAVEAIAVGVPIHVMSAQDGRGVDELRRYLKPGGTVALLGSSGVGKSSLINALLGEQRLPTAAVRADDSHGRHTTTHRELLVLPGGGVIIDTPGMRELQLWASDESLAGAFGDVEELAAGCRFRDCRHAAEPGCAVRAALADGRLDEGRHASYVKLKRELAYLARREDVGAQVAEKERWKKIHVQAKKWMKEKGKQ